MLLVSSVSYHTKIFSSLQSPKERKGGNLFTTPWLLLLLPVTQTRGGEGKGSSFTTPLFFPRIPLAAAISIRTNKGRRVEAPTASFLTNPQGVSNRDSGVSNSEILGCLIWKPGMSNLDTWGVSFGHLGCPIEISGVWNSENFGYLIWKPGVSNMKTWGV